MKISIIIPCLNEQADILETLKPLQAMRKRGHQVILCDANSQDETCSLAKPWVDDLINSQAGRALQMNTAAKLARHEILWFLHADTRVPENADQLIINSLMKHFIWGRFNIKLSGQALIFRVIEKLINIRSCFSSIATGDQGIFVTHQAFKQINGFQTIALMEDIDLSKRLKKLSRACCLSTTIITSSRRWESQGILKTTLLMWSLRLAYFLGISPDKLAQTYRKF